MKKTIGLVLLTVGISLTAGFGAVLSPDFRSATTKVGGGDLRGSSGRRGSRDLLHAS